MPKYYSIGCDCHPTHVLTTLKLRHGAGPFDHNYTSGTHSIPYLMELIETNFENFLSDLARNTKGHMISKNYPNTEFIHDKNLKRDPEAKSKYERRIARFIKDYKEEKCILFYCIDEHCVKNANNLANSIMQLLESKYFKTNDHVLFAYLRYNEEIHKECDFFVEEMKKIKNKNLIFKQYVRKLKKYGIWGNEEEYFDFFTVGDQSS